MSGRRRWWKRRWTQSRDPLKSFEIDKKTDFTVEIEPEQNFSYSNITTGRVDGTRNLTVDIRKRLKTNENRDKSRKYCCKSRLDVTRL